MYIHFTALALSPSLLPTYLYTHYPENSRPCTLVHLFRPGVVYHLSIYDREIGNAGRHHARRMLAPSLMLKSKRSMGFLGCSIVGSTPTVQI
ncbi:hypothetical protein C8F01DRAFT_792575 [Mycena amicta]|nr:hypothetical protein C8F01DRAFT_792575 [Mycena amicta]